MQRRLPPVSLLCLALVLLVAVAYAPSYLPYFHHEFTNYDDPDYVTLNKHVQKGLTWPGVAWACAGVAMAAVRRSCAKVASVAILGRRKEVRIGARGEVGVDDGIPIIKLPKPASTESSDCVHIELAS